MILIVALTGNVGKNGGGFNHYVGQERVWPVKGFGKLAFPRTGKKQRFQNTTLWTYIHSTNHDPHLYNGQSIESYIKESVEKGWMPLYPTGGRKPRSMIIWRANYLNQAKGNEMVTDSLWKDLDLIVDINYRMDTTALYSDIVLPAASYYEKTDLNTTDCHSFIHPFGKVLDPLFESKTDWEIFRLLTQRIAAIAKERGLKPYHDPQFDWDRDLTTAYQEWSDGGKLEDDEAACDFIMSESVETKGMTYQQLADGPPQRFVETSEHWNSDIEEGVAYTPFKHQVEAKKPWPTLTGRQQFYLDHPWFLKLGEALPGYKSPVSERYPLFWNTPHGRWSIHSTWRDNRSLLRLQRGGPIVRLNPQVAAARSIEDNDWVRIYNDVGSLVCRAVIQPNQSQTQITMYHGWEKYLGFLKGGWQSLTYIKIKPTQLVGKYGHLRFQPNYWGPTGNNRDIQVEVQRLGPGEWATVPGALLQKLPAAGRARI